MDNLEQDFIDSLEDRVYVIVELLHNEPTLIIRNVGKYIYHLKDPKLEVISRRMTLDEIRIVDKWKVTILNSPTTHYFIAKFNDIKTPCNVS